MFFTEFREKHRIDDATFLVDGAPWSQTAGKLAHVDQRRRYVSHFEREEAETWTVRGILVVPEIGKMGKMNAHGSRLRGRRTC